MKIQFHSPQHLTQSQENESVKVNLSSDFKTEYEYLMVQNNVKVEIDGDHHKYDEAFQVSSWGAGDLVFKNFNFIDNGEFGDDVYFAVQDSGEGTVTVDSFTFKNIENKMYAPLRDETNDNNLIVTNSLFENNESYYGGGIEALSTNGTTFIKNSSFLNNKSHGEVAERIVDWSLQKVSRLKTHHLLITLTPAR